MFEMLLYDVLPIVMLVMTALWATDLIRDISKRLKL